MLTRADDDATAIDGGTARDGREDCAAELGEDDGELAARVRRHGGQRPAADAPGQPDAAVSTAAAAPVPPAA